MMNRILGISVLIAVVIAVIAAFYAINFSLIRVAAEDFPGGEIAIFADSKEKIGSYIYAEGSLDAWMLVKTVGSPQISIEYPCQSDGRREMIRSGYIPADTPQAMEIAIIGCRDIKVRYFFP